MLVYIGAVAILIVFAILLTRSSETTPQPVISKSWVLRNIAVARPGIWRAGEGDSVESDCAARIAGKTGTNRAGNRDAIDDPLRAAIGSNWSFADRGGHWRSHHRDLDEPGSQEKSRTAVQNVGSRSLARKSKPQDAAVEKLETINS